MILLLVLFPPQHPLVSSPQGCHSHSYQTPTQLYWQKVNTGWHILVSQNWFCQVFAFIVFYLFLINWFHYSSPSLFTNKDVRKSVLLPKYSVGSSFANCLLFVSFLSGWPVGWLKVVWQILQNWCNKVLDYSLSSWTRVSVTWQVWTKQHTCQDY